MFYVFFFIYHLAFYPRLYIKALIGAGYIHIHVFLHPKLFDISACLTYGYTTS